jgi:RAQPRD family integrative conjugative element protein
MMEHAADFQQSGCPPFRISRGAKAPLAAASCLPFFTEYAMSPILPLRRLVPAARFCAALFAARFCAALFAAGFSCAYADEAPERERLAALVRQLDLVERLAGQAEQAASPGAARYRFDYARLRGDLARVRAGVTDYLAPPRDPLPLSGEYRLPRPAAKEAP